MQVHLRIGAVTVSVESGDARLLTPLTGPHQLFATPPAPADLALTVRRLARYEPAAGTLLFDSGGVWQLHEDGDAWRIECRSFLFGDVPYKIARVSRDLRRADVFVRDLDGKIPDALEYPLDELLFNAVLARNDGIEFHACGVVDHDGSGYLFAGNSGDGKTTTARLWIGDAHDIVSDDRVIVRREDGTWWMYGTPWHGEAEICSTSRAPLRRIFLLNKAQESRMDPVPRSHAVARLFACAFPPFHDRAGIETMLGTLDRLATEVPVARFSFVNDRSAVAAVRAAAPAGVVA